MDSNHGAYEQLCAAVKAAGWKIVLDRSDDGFGLHVLKPTGRFRAAAFVFPDIEDIDSCAALLLDWLRDVRSKGTDATLL